MMSDFFFHFMEAQFKSCKKTALFYIISNFVTYYTYTLSEDKQ